MPQTPNSFRGALRESIVESTIGFILLGIGLAGSLLSAILGEDTVSAKVLTAVGGFVAVIGGVLVSWGTTRVYSQREERAALNPRLASVQHQVSIVAAQLKTLGIDLARPTFHNQTATELLKIHGNALSAVVDDLTGLTGEQPAVPEWVATLELMRDLSAQLSESALHPESADPVAVEETRVQMETALAALTDQLPLPVEPARTTCPHCGTLATVPLGTGAGSSGLPTCTSCGKRYHVHRRGDGTVFSKAEGSAGRRVAPACPNCGQPVNVTIRNEGAAPLTRYCLRDGCMLKLTIDPTTGSISQSEVVQPTMGTIVDETLRPAAIRCSSCSETMGAFTVRGSAYFGTCPKENKLVRAPFASLKADSPPAA